MFELILRIGFSLLIVLGLMWGLAKLARRPLAGGRGGASALTVLTRQQLSRNASVAVVRIADTAMVIGITDGQITMLGETDLAAIERHLAPSAERRDAIAVDGDTPAVTPVVTTASGRLDGSLLSPRTWASTVDFLRERTVRR